MKQYTIDGSIVDVELDKDYTMHRKQKTIKEKFRNAYGYNYNARCKDCENCIYISTGMRNYYKCRIMGTSASAATDIRLKDYGCKVFTERRSV